MDTTKTQAPYLHYRPITQQEQWPFVLLLVLTGCAFGYALACILPGPINDEGFHGPQVWQYYSGGTQHYDSITMPSTYHYILAFIAKSIGYYHDNLLRFLNMLGALFLLPIFYRTAVRYLPEHAPLRTLQIFFAPLIFPYFFVIYTDLWALTLIALCFYLTLEKRYILAGAAGFCALMIRQDAIIWIGLAYLLVCFDGITLKRPLPIRQALKNGLLHGAPYLVLFTLFVAFVIYNGGVAIGDSKAHQIQNLNINNLYAFLICAWLLFLPLCIQQLPNIWIALKKPWVWILIIGGFLLFMNTVSNPHPYNRIIYHYFLHNGLMYLLAEYHVAVRVLFYLPIAWMALTLCVMKYPDKRCYWMLAVIPVAVILHPLVEPRYYFPAYLLINWWRPAMSLRAESITVGIYMLFAAYLMFGTATLRFFL